MILQALTQYYQALEREGNIAAPGWSPVKVSFALQISGGGELEQALPLLTQQVRGKKTVLAPRSIILPAPVKRTVGIAANFLCDNAGYILGAYDENKDKGEKDKTKRTLDCFAACRALHEQVLDGVNTPAAQALLAFFRAWEPEKAKENPVLADHLEEILSGANLVFRTEDGFVHDDPAVRQAWDRFYSRTEDAPRGICLVTGEEGPVEAVHPAIKNVAGAQSSGAALVSFNAPAFCSYGKEQNLNAPTSKYAAFAYTAALNHLLSDRDHVYRLGDATVVCWAKNAKPAYTALFGGACFGSVSYTAADMQGMVKTLCSGQPVVYEEEKLDPNMDFYVLALSPNAARLSVRFFLHNSFGNLLKNVQAHYDRLEIVRPASDKFETLSLWKLLDETVNQNSSNKSPSPNLAGAVLRAVLNNTRYPATLLNGVTLRIRADRKITRGRAAILKAYYLQNPHPDIPKEVLTVSLKEESTNIPYTLGRLFSVLEAVQTAANPGINATIRDKYFNSAGSTPAVVFPVLVNLAQKHLKKLRGNNAGLAVFYEKQLTELCARLGENYPARMSLPQQGAFQLGYYHQTQARYQKKEEK